MKFYVEEVEKKLNYTFKNKQLLKQAFVHASYGNETGAEDNERMEFFGDSVLEYISSEYLYRKYPHCSAGELSKLRSQVVSADGLRPVVESLDIMRHLLVANGAGQIKAFSKKIEANLYEAVLCAIFLDGGMAAAKRFVMSTLKRSMDDALSGEKKDYKSKLQEYCQERKWTIVYKQESRSGPDNKPMFVYSVWIDGKKCGEGIGSSIKKAEQNAAGKIVRSWRI